MQVWHKINAYGTNDTYGVNSKNLHNITYGINCT